MRQNGTDCEPIAFTTDCEWPEIFSAWMVDYGDGNGLVVAHTNEKPIATIHS
jgi:hypothetical protein